MNARTIPCARRRALRGLRALAKRMGTAKLTSTIDKMMSFATDSPHSYRTPAGGVGLGAFHTPAICGKRNAIA